jgi:preprotein translocase subunit SecA
MAWSAASWSSAATTSPIVDEVDSILIDEARTR